MVWVSPVKPINLALSLHAFFVCAPRLSLPPANLFAATAAKSLQSCPTLCDPIDGSPPGSPVPGILQARTLEWVAISFSSKSLYHPAQPQCNPTFHELRFKCFVTRLWWKNSGLQDQIAIGSNIQVFNKCLFVGGKNKG